LQWQDEQIREQVEACLPPLENLFLVDVVLNQRRGAHQLIVRCETDTGITVDELARINRTLRDEFSLPGMDTDQLSVEVTSPGPAISPNSVRHFKRHLGHELKVRHHAAPMETPLRGVLQSVDESELELLVDGQPIRLSLQSIDEARVQYQW